MYLHRIRLCLEDIAMRLNIDLGGEVDLVLAALGTRTHKLPN